MKKNFFFVLYKVDDISKSIPTTVIVGWSQSPRNIPSAFTYALQSVQFCLKPYTIMYIMPTHDKRRFNISRSTQYIITLIKNKLVYFHYYYNFFFVDSRNQTLHLWSFRVLTAQCHSFIYSNFIRNKVWSHYSLIFRREKCGEKQTIIYLRLLLKKVTVSYAKVNNNLHLCKIIVWLKLKKKKKYFVI